MRRSWTIPVITLIAGITGAFLRNRELNTIFDQYTGLAEKNAAVTLMSIALAVAVMLFAIISSLVAGSKNTASILYSEAFRTDSFLGYVLSAIMGVIVIIGGTMIYISGNELEISNITLIIYAVFAVLSGICMTAMATCAFTRKCGTGTRLASLVPELFFSLWLAIVYKENATSPVIIGYCYKCIALAAAALCFYYAAGYAFGRVQTKMTIISHVATIYFMLVTLADDWGNFSKIIICASLVFTIMNLIRFLVNLEKAQAKQM